MNRPAATRPAVSVLPAPPWLGALGTAAMVAGAGLVATTALIHLHLYVAGYRHIPTIGLLFMAQAVSGLVLAPVLAVGRRTIVVLAGALYMAASVGGLLLSATVGFLGLHDGLGVPWAATSLTVEIIGALLLCGAGALALRRR